MGVGNIVASHRVPTSEFAPNKAMAARRPSNTSHFQGLDLRRVSAGRMYIEAGTKGAAILLWRPDTWQGRAAHDAGFREPVDRLGGQRV